jgi:two-component system, NtrC family, sensor histidine kinase HydH
MTIRRTLLLSFLAISLLPTAALTFLSFVQARKALEAEIARNLLVQASTAMTQIDGMLFERLENVRTWTGLEVMQEIRIGDIDKRVSHVLQDLRAGHEVYDLLFCTTADGKVVAASDQYMLGQQIPASSTWLTASFSGGSIALEPLSFSPAAQKAHLSIRAPIADVFQPGNLLGTLYAFFDWEEIFRILDQTAQNATAKGKGRMALLLDHDGRIVAASSLLRQRGLLLSSALAAWQPAQQARSGVLTIDGQPLGISEVLVGYAHSAGYQHFQGFGWSTLVVQPTPQAFLPIQRMGLSFLLLLILTGVIAVGASLFIASRLAQPILSLADFTRHFASRRASAVPPTPGTGEIGELTAAFVQMIQDLERSREDLIRAAKLAVVGEMAAAMAHEVRTPLGILRSSAQMLQREPQLSPEGQEMAGFVLSETDRLNRLISALLDLARPRPPVFHSQDIHVIIRRALDLLGPRAARQRVRIVEELRASPSTLPCDEELLVQVFLNLLLNALQMLPAEGAVIVRTAIDADQLIVEVFDNGPGIPPENRQRVFDPFFTTRERGVGLGLTVVQQIVRSHGGNITVHEGPSGGACFRFYFPSLRNVEAPDMSVCIDRR